MTVVRLTGITKSYKNAGEVLKNINIEFENGKMYGIMGPSGSGKSTLLNIIGTLEKQSEGTVEILGNNLEGYSEKELCDLRAKHIGYVFQNFYLNPYLSAVENVMVPMKVNNDIEPSKRKEIAEDLMKRFGLKERMKK